MQADSDKKNFDFADYRVSPGGLGELSRNALCIDKVINRIQPEHHFHVNDTLQVVEIHTFYSMVDAAVPPSTFKSSHHLLPAWQRRCFLLFGIVFRIDMHEHLGDVLALLDEMRFDPVANHVSFRNRKLAFHHHVHLDQ